MATDYLPPTQLVSDPPIVRWIARRPARPIEESRGRGWSPQLGRLRSATGPLSRFLRRQDNRPRGLIRHSNCELGNAPAVFDRLLQIIANEGALKRHEVCHGSATGEGCHAIEVALQPPLTQLEAFVRQILQAVGEHRAGLCDGSEIPGNLLG